MGEKLVEFPSRKVLKRKDRDRKKKAAASLPTFKEREESARDRAFDTLTEFTLEPVNFNCIFMEDWGFCFVRRHAHIDWKVKLVAAFKAAQTGGNSVDYLLKRYGEAWREQLLKRESDERAI